MPPKRKSDESTHAAKKARTSTHAPAQALVTAILANTSSHPISDDPVETRNSLVQLAQYARSLEEDVGRAAQGTSQSAPVQKTKEQLEEAAEKIKRTAVSGIKKQMSVSAVALRHWFKHVTDAFRTA